MVGIPKAKSHVQLRSSSCKSVGNTRIGGDRRTGRGLGKKVRGEGMKGAKVESGDLGIEQSTESVQLLLYF